jgi:hypothetical protein
MFRHCIYCKSELGSNDAIENFPIGRRLAFDSERGRLWAICRHCNRWNLSPLEERWEAINECERLYSQTRTRLATENVGLARLKEGTDLVRIGQPQRPEFAAWRYGQELVRRRRKDWVAAGVVTGAALGVWLAGPALGLFAAGSSTIIFQAPNVYNLYRNFGRTVLKLPAGMGQQYVLRGHHVRKARLVSVGNHWRLSLPYQGEEIQFKGDDALRTAGQILPHINLGGATDQQIQGAVTRLQGMSSPMQYFEATAKQYTGRYRWSDHNLIARIPAEVRIGLEMAAHEEQERRALEGELKELEAMWREAEEIAAISDNLLVPPFILDYLKKRHRRG